VLIVNRIAAAPPGKTYQVWVLKNGAATPAGHFPGGSGRSVVPVEATVDVGNLVAVTVENAGGATKPTTEPLVTSLPA
jgi:anti-sigma-K factor RskA